MPKGRPKGSKNKPKEVVAEKKRGRPAGSKNTPKVVLPPKAEGTVEPIHGFQEVTKAFGLTEYLNYANIPDMELKPDDMGKAVERYHERFSTLPKRVVIHERNEHLLPYLYSHVPDIEAGLVLSTAIWEMKFQIP